MRGGHVLDLALMGCIQPDTGTDESREFVWGVTRSEIVGRVSAPFFSGWGAQSRYAGARNPPSLRHSGGLRRAKGAAYPPYAIGPRRGRRC